MEFVFSKQDEEDSVTAGDDIDMFEAGEDIDMKSTGATTTIRCHSHVLLSQSAYFKGLFEFKKTKVMNDSS